MIKRRILLMAAASAFALCTSAAIGQDNYPSRTVRSSCRRRRAGRSTWWRAWSRNTLATSIGQSVVVDNRPGAGNTIGSREAARAEPDGYTLHYSSVSGLVLAPMLHKDPGYDPIKSFAPIAAVATTSIILVVHPSFPAKSVKELVDYAKANPGKVNFSSGGIGVLPHLIGEMFKARAGVNIVHVPYKGGGPSIQDVVAGNVQMTFEGTGVLLPLIAAGKLRALAVTSAQRNPATARRADHGRKRLSGLRHRRLDRAAGARRHAGADRRQAQCRDQQRAEVAGAEGCARQVPRRPARRHAGRVRRDDQGRHRQMGTGGEVAASEDELNVENRLTCGSRHASSALSTVGPSLVFGPACRIRAPLARAQTRRSREELTIYAGLHEAAAKGDVAEIERLIADGEKLNIQDSKSRTPLHVAVYLKKYDAVRALLKAGANPNALEIDRYDIVTIAAVANDVEMLKIVLEGGASAKNITSRYDGTALIAAAHLGHVEVGAHPDRGQGAAQPRQQSRLDRADGVDRARQRRREPYRDAASAGRGRRRRQHSPTATASRRCSTRASAAMSRWRASWKPRARVDSCESLR